MIFYLALIMIISYSIQIIFSWYQIKNFNTVYSLLRKKGKVAIGKKAGRIRAGTIIMLSIDMEENIVDAYQMQGFTVFSKFKSLNDLVNISINDLNENHPSISEKNKLTKTTIMQAKDIYINVKNNTYEEETPYSMVSHMKNSLMIINLEAKMKLERFRGRIK